MSLAIVAKIWNRVIGFASRHRRITGLSLCLLSLVGFASATGVLISTLGSPARPGVRFHLFNVVAVGALWMFLAQTLSRRPTPVHAFWNLFLTGILGVVLSAGTLRFLPGGFTDAGVALNLPTAISMSLLMLMALSFSFVLVQRLRALIHYRRSTGSLLVWRLMLAGVVVAALIVGSQDRVPEAMRAFLDAAQPVTVAAVVILMAVNCFRLSWIVRLSFREKLLTMLLATALLSLLFVVERMGAGAETTVGSMTVASDVQGNEGYFAYLHAYSGVLAVSVQLAGLFGILYCLTTILSLLFHLPTTGDFQRRQNEITAMQGLTGLVREVFDPDKLLRTITSSPIEAGSATSSWLALADADSGTLKPRLVATAGVTSEVLDRIDIAALYREVQQTSQPVLLQRAPADRRVMTRTKDGIASLFAVPLSARQQIMGVLFVAKRTLGGFEPDDVDAVRMYAAQAALALENARLFEEQVRSERLARELALAREIQSKLLPRSAPRVPGLSFAASSVSAYEVGGDYHDYTKLPNGRVAFIVADVSGKGTSAAFYMAELRGAFNALVHISADPSIMLSHINRALWNSLEKNVFITAIYGVVDTKNASISIARAGHCPAAFVDHTGKASLVRTKGLGIGLDQGSLFEQTLEVTTMPLHNGDLFGFYTDGITEARNATGDEYGYDRCLQVMQTHQNEDADQIRHALLQDVQQFVGKNNSYGDDLTIVVLKWAGMPDDTDAARSDKTVLLHSDTDL